MKTAFLFAGQGAQKVGMGKDFYDHFPEVRALYDENNLDFDIAKCCFEGPAEMLNDTAYAQSCLLLTSYVMADRLKQCGVVPGVVAGLSLGEYTALTYAGAFNLKDALTVVRKRGQLMAHALPAGTGMMAAVLNADEALVAEVCAKASKVGVCDVANYNCPGQIVISGETAAVEKAKAMLLEKGVRRVMPLNVSGAFHSSLLEEASFELKAVLDHVVVDQPTVPVIYNVSGDFEEKPVKELLIKQIHSSVYFEKSIRKMLAEGVDTFIEIGPGKTCGGFVKKIDKTVKVHCVEDLTSFEKFLAE
ncbi:MAG: ACP S-malonyltransferase [Eubacterium sp.]